MIPFHRSILKTWMTFEGEVAAVVDKHDLTPEQLRDFVKDPEVREIMDSYEELVARRLRMTAMHHQSSAAEALSKAMFEATKPEESRRAATALARLTKEMIKGPAQYSGSGLSARPDAPAGRTAESKPPIPASPGPAGGGGRGLARPEGVPGTTPDPRLSENAIGRADKPQIPSRAASPASA